MFPGSIFVIFLSFLSYFSPHFWYHFRNWGILEIGVFSSSSEDSSDSSTDGEKEGHKEGIGLSTYALGSDQEIKLPFAKRFLWIRLYAPKEAVRCGTLGDETWDDRGLKPGMGVRDLRTGYAGIVKYVTKTSVFVQFIDGASYYVNDVENKLNLKGLQKLSRSKKSYSGSGIKLFFPFQFHIFFKNHFFSKMRWCSWCKFRCR